MITFLYKWTDHEMWIFGFYYKFIHKFAWDCFIQYPYLLPKIGQSLRKEGNVLFNNALNTFYLRLYGVGQSDSERRNLAPATWATLSDYQQWFFYMHHPIDMIVHTTAFVAPVVEHWLWREIAQWVHHEGSIQWPIAPWANTLTTELRLAPAIIKAFDQFEGRKEVNILFNDPLKTFLFTVMWRQTYGKGLFR